MYSAHFHLLLNHWPILGTFIALGLLVSAVVSAQNSLKQASLALFVFIALMAVPAYMSGNSAHEFLKETPEVSMDLVQTHQGAALLALISMELTGIFSWVGLWQFSRKKRVAGWNTAVVLLFSILTFGLMSVTGTTGGEIRHPEIVSAPEARSSIGAAGLSLLPKIQYLVTESSRYVWGALEALHFIGLILILASVGLLNLRLLGCFRKLPVAPIHRLIPWGVAGVFINIFTGMLFFVCMPDFYANNPDFQLKMVAIVAAGTNLMLFYCTTAFHPLALLGPQQDAPVLAKVVAASSLFLWVAIIVLGRYMPFWEVAK
jgi:uncharacterized membrane protein